MKTSQVICTEIASRSFEHRLLVLLLDRETRTVEQLCKQYIFGQHTLAKPETFASTVTKSLRYLRRAGFVEPDGPQDWVITQRGINELGRIAAASRRALSRKIIPMRKLRA